MRAASVVVLLVAGLAADPAPAQSYLVVVTGLPGEPRHAARFHEWAATLIRAATGRWGMPPSHVVYLADTLGSGATGRSTRDAIGRTLEDLAARAEPDAVVSIFFFGHGSEQGGEARFHVAGPDLTARDFAAMLARFPTQRLVVVNAASASGPWVEALSGERRAVITATRSGAERHETLFGQYFVEALAGDAADTDKDERVSVLEAFVFARGEVTRAYQEDDRLLTEHALLDDDGDGQGNGEPGGSSGDGALARSTFLGGPGGPGAAGDPALAALYARRDSLERRIAEHRARKGALSSDEYERGLEVLLLELARTSQTIREREARPR